MSQIRILSWNIQNGLGTDGIRSLDRIAAEIDAMGRPDVLCLQEVSRFIPFDADSERPDQLAQLKALFNEYEAVFGPAFDMVLPETGQRAQYGNLVLSRLPVLSRFSHCLPQPARAGRKQMPRQATEVTVATGPDQAMLRIVTTHLEFHSKGQRLAQIESIRCTHEQVVDIQRHQPAFTDQGPYQNLRRSAQAIIAGDLNCLPDSAELKALVSPASDADAQLVEVWPALNPDQPHEPTCGVFDDQQWPQGPHCRDFFVASESLIESCEQLTTNTVTDASDHQPIVLSMAL